MNMQRHHVLASSTATAASLAFPFERVDMPKMIVDFPAGSTPEMLARKVGKHLAAGDA